jgi:hypothetical protein
MSISISSSTTTTIGACDTGSNSGISSTTTSGTTGGIPSGDI